MNQTEDLLKGLGKRIAGLRKQSGMSQEEFADVSGKMINTISNIERGLSDPKITTLYSVSEALGVPIEALFDSKWQWNTEQLSEPVRGIVVKIKDLDPKILEVIRKQIDALLEIKQKV